MAELFDTGSEERTENATQHRREEFRRRGSVAYSREILSILLLAGVGTSFYWGCGIIFREFTSLSETYFRWGRPEMFDKSHFMDTLIHISQSGMWMVLPMFGVAILCSILAGVMQVGVMVTTEPLTPDWNRISPVEGFKRIFSAQGLVEGLKAVIKLLIAGVLTWFLLNKEIRSTLFLFRGNVSEISVLTMESMGRVFFTLLLSLSVVAVLDYVYQKYRHEQSLKMTKREAKDEFKLREGDPLIRSRMRGIQRRIATRRMMEEVPKADVVVTNPTHLAVALRYDSEAMHAPKVTAKGAGPIAQKIREVARFHQVPLVENKPLARTLYRDLDIGEFIPKELYKAVAEVLAYVYRLKTVTQSRVYASP